MPDLLLSGSVYVLDPNAVAQIVQTNGQYPLSITGYVTPSSAPPTYPIPPQLPPTYSYPSGYYPLSTPGYVTPSSLPGYESPLTYSYPSGYYPPVSPPSLPVFAIPPGSVSSPTLSPSLGASIFPIPPGSIV